MPLIKPAESGRGVRSAVALDLSDLSRQGEAIVARAREEAAAIVSAARAERQRLIADAAEKGRVEGTSRGHAEGRESGLAQGRAEALAEWRERLETLERNWTTALAAFESQREAMVEDARIGAVRLALAVAERVIGRAIAADPSPIAAQVEAVLRALARPSALTISVHPADEEAVRTALPGLAGRIAAAKSVTVVADDALDRGACVARTAGGVIDASVGVQLDRIAAALLPDGAEDAP